MFSLFRRQTPSKQAPVPKPIPKATNNNDFYQEGRTTLPDNFAQNILQMEMRLEFDESFTLETVQSLNDLYRIAVEYYVNVDAKKAQHFQRKLTNLLTHPRTLNIIEDKQRAKSLNPRPSTTEATNKLKQQVLKFNSQANSVVKTMIQSSQQKLQTSENIIRDNIKKQEDEVRNRIIERSRSKRKA